MESDDLLTPASPNSNRSFSTVKQRIDTFVPRSSPLGHSAGVRSLPRQRLILFDNLNRLIDNLNRLFDNLNRTEFPGRTSYLAHPIWRNNQHCFSNGRFREFSPVSEILPLLHRNLPLLGCNLTLVHCNLLALSTIMNPANLLHGIDLACLTDSLAVPYHSTSSPSLTFVSALYG